MSAALGDDGAGEVQVLARQSRRPRLIRTGLGRARASRLGVCGNMIKCNLEGCGRSRSIFSPGVNDDGRHLDCSVVSCGTGWNVNGYVLRTIPFVIPRNTTQHCIFGYTQGFKSTSPPLSLPPLSHPSKYCISILPFRPFFYSV